MPALSLHIVLFGALAAAAPQHLQQRWISTTTAAHIAPVSTLSVVPVSVERTCTDAFCRKQPNFPIESTATLGDVVPIGTTVPVVAPAQAVVPVAQGAALPLAASAVPIDAVNPTPFNAVPVIAPVAPVPAIVPANQAAGLGSGLGLLTDLTAGVGAGLNGMLDLVCPRTMNRY